MALGARNLNATSIPRIDFLGLRDQVRATNHLVIVRRSWILFISPFDSALIIITGGDDRDPLIASRKSSRRHESLHLH
ncbi:hypothetical protein TNIN_254251 [Trichonephila inaurata madagascariensis]|uniref:Uncharacterized protein n=1 Tax=Trichonephila inaurata madagascariensis TaxID=2747483 RepID=A0A8X6XGD1_9ARAC|nr:hypothetical protein TNIN_254251 [Trichonephila inaurata madagascariensis]